MFGPCSLISCSLEAPPFQRQRFQSSSFVWFGLTYYGPICFLLGELGVRMTSPILLHYDNLSATYLATNPIHHACMRHIHLDYHFVREKVAIGSHRVCYIPSVDRRANLLTKALHQPRHGLLCFKLVSFGSSSLQGSQTSIKLLRNPLRDCSM